MDTRSTTATTADAYVSAETPRSTAYLLANRLFADAPQRTEIIVKRRRLAVQAPAADESLQSPARPEQALTPDDGNRVPRVFVVAREEAVAAVPAESAAEQPAQPGRRRVEPVRLPGKVVLIVPPRVDAEPRAEPMQAPSAQPAVGDLDFLLHRVQEQRDLKAALDRVKALTADAQMARKLRF